MTYTQTHVAVEFANPYLVCTTCRKRVTGWHDHIQCGCDEGVWNDPCGHRSDIDEICPSWGPVDGCRCQRDLGYVPHGPVEPAAPVAAEEPPRG